MIDLTNYTVISARLALKNGEITSRDLVEASLNAIKEKDGEVHAFLEVYDDC